MGRRGKKGGDPPSSDFGAAGEVGDACQRLWPDRSARPDWGEGWEGALEGQGVCLGVRSRYIVTTIVNIGRF